MNCECIYYRKGATREDLLRLANAIESCYERWGFEKYPTALSVITKDIKCSDDYDGFGRKKTIPVGSEVLFVGGKLHYMCEVYIETKKYLPWFPIKHDMDFFEDIQTEFPVDRFWERWENNETL